MLLSAPQVLVVLSLLTSEAFAQTQRKLGQYEKITDNIESFLIQGYNHKYRPPRVNASSTEVKISLRSFRALQYDLDTSIASITFNTLQEYNETRLKFDSRMGLSVVQLPPKFNLWRAKLHFPSTVPLYSPNNLIVDYELFDSWMSNQLVPKTTFVNAGGTVALRRGLDEKVLGLRGTPVGNMTRFTLKIVAKQRLQEVKLLWNMMKPVTLENEGELVAGILKGEQYQLKNFTQGTCMHEEDFGSMGMMEYSCLKLDFFLESLNAGYTYNYNYMTNATSTNYKHYNNTPSSTRSSLQ